MANELYHHGILGQKWGKRNGPPYPLGVSDHSVSEKKAGWRKSLGAKTSDSSTTIKNGRSEKSKSTKTAKVTEEELRNYREEMIAKSSKNASRREFFKNATDKEILDDIERKQKMKRIALAAAAGVGLTAAVWLAYKYSACSSISELVEEGNVSPEALKKVMERTLEDGTTILDKGSIIHRMEGYSDIDYSKMTNPLYTSYKDTDVVTYMTMLKDWAGTGKRYDVSLEAVKDIRIPSKEKAVELFNELWDNDPEYRNSLRESLINAKINAISKLYRPGEFSKDEIIESVDQELSKDPFGRAIYSMVLKGNDSKMYTEKLKKAGYDAVIDYFDKGKMADAPLIILDPSKTLQKVGEQEVTKQLKIDALQKLKAQGITKLAGFVSIDDLMKW